MMDNRYSHFANDGMRDIESILNEAKDNAKRSFLGWQDMMEEQLVEDTLETLKKLRNDGDPSDEEFAWRATAVLKFLVHDFASGILYAQEKLG